MLPPVMNVIGGSLASSYTIFTVTLRECGENAFGVPRASCNLTV